MCSRRVTARETLALLRGHERPGCSESIFFIYTDETRKTQGADHVTSPSAYICSRTTGGWSKGGEERRSAIHRRCVNRTAKRLRARGRNENEIVRTGRWRTKGLATVACAFRKPPTSCFYCFASSGLRSDSSNVWTAVGAVRARSTTREVATRPLLPTKLKKSCLVVRCNKLLSFLLSPRVKYQLVDTLITNDTQNFFYRRIFETCRAVHARN